MKSISVDFLKNWLIAILLFVVIVLSDAIGQKNKELKEKQTSIEEMRIQITSLWENVLQLQEEYGKIVDKLYNPNLGVDNDAKTKPIKNGKFRIFVDGSYDDKVNIGTVAYHMQNIVNFENRVINVCVHNKTFAQKVDCKHSVDAELKAIKLGFDTFNKMVKVHPILNKLPARVKSDNVPIIKYITKGKWKDDVDFDDSLLDDLNLLKEEYANIRQKHSNFKLSYIPSKKNLAHNNAYEMLQWERGVNNE